MSEPIGNAADSDGRLENVRIFKGIRFALVSVLLAISCLTLRCCFEISAVRSIAADMIEGKPLPLVASVVFRFELPFLILSTVIPVLALTTLCMKNLPRSFYVLGALGLTSCLLLALVWEAIWRPFTMLLN